MRLVAKFFDRFYVKKEITAPHFICKVDLGAWMDIRESRKFSN